MTANRNVLPGIKFVIALARVGEVYFTPTYTGSWKRQSLQPYHIMIYHISKSH
ncbi:hypothetical protein HanRHA438_Chr17g0808901 [Helianthus annuus]|nr:hypothetical protein HanRHA438_Chr17g0808901 [Helianthus annuus]